jgi:hypothetical protein
MKPFLAPLVSGLVALQDLDGDGSVQPRVFGVEYLSHAAGTDRSFDLVRADLRAWLQCVTGNSFQESPGSTFLS